MNPAVESIPASEPVRVLRERCAQVGMALWRVDATGVAIERPRGAEVLSRWGASPFIEAAIRRAARRWADNPAPAPELLFEGCWVVPIPEINRRRLAGYIVCIALGEDALKTDQFRAACGASHLDVEAAQAALEPFAVWNARSIAASDRLLGWCLEDQRSIASFETTLEGFSSQLTDSFEEISLLYTLGRSMNQLVHPQKFVKQVCEELHATLAFQWIGVRFVSGDRLARGMADRLFVSGKMPCDATSFGAETTRILATLDDGASVIIPGEHLGELCSSPDQSDQVLVHPVVRDGHVVGALMAGGKQGADAQVSSVDRKLLDAASGYLSILLDNAFLYDDQQLMFVGTLEALTASIDAKDPYTHGHSERVAHLAAELGRAYGLDEEQVERVRIAGLVHDIGKIGIPEAVLCKSGNLTSEEYAKIREHPEIGYRILKDIPMMDDLLPAVLYHHERLDGTGYPHRLQGDEIPLFARIVCVVDSFDAMSSTRTYREALTRADVLGEIRDNAGTQFDAEMVDLLMGLDLSRYDELVAKRPAVVEARLKLPPRGSAA